MKNKRLTIIVLICLLLLLIPLIAMQFTNEVQWTLLDFIVGGGLLLATGILCELVLRNKKTTKYHILFCGAIILVFLFIWAALAVGI